MTQLYIPENLNLKQLLCDAGKIKQSNTYLERYYYIISRILYQGIRGNTKDKNKYVRICSHEIRDIISKRHTASFFDDLIDLGVIECDYNAKPKVRCNGYRLTEGYRNQKLKVIFVTQSLLNQNIKKKHQKDERHIYALPKHNAALYHHIKRLKVDYRQAHRFIKKHYGNDFRRFNYRKLTIDMIDSQDYFFSRSEKGGRLFTNITSFPKELRQFLVVEDLWTQQRRKLIEIDIKSSQPMFFLIYLIKFHSDRIPASEIDGFKGILESGFYEYFMEKLGIEDRSKVKVDAYQKLLFRPYFKNKFTQYELLFEHKFPAIFQLLTDLKKTHGHEYISHRMQELESKFIVDFISKRYTRQFPDGFIATIHDSILILDSHAQEYVELITERLNSNWGINVQLHVSEVNPKTLPDDKTDVMDGGTLHNPKKINTIHLPEFPLQRMNNGRSRNL